MPFKPSTVYIGHKADATLTICRIFKTCLVFGGWGMVVSGSDDEMRPKNMSFNTSALLAIVHSRIQALQTYFFVATVLSYLFVNVGMAVHGSVFR